MSRVIALLVALAFALGVGTTPVWAQAPKQPAKPEQKAPPAVKKQVDINSASADELKTLKGLGEADTKKIVENRPYKTQRGTYTEERCAKDGLRQDQGPDRRQVGAGIKTGRLIEVGRSTLNASTVSQLFFA
jgi:hypothetical protein